MRAYIMTTPLANQMPKNRQMAIPRNRCQRIAYLSQNFIRLEAIPYGARYIDRYTRVELGCLIVDGSDKVVRLVQDVRHVHCVLDLLVTIMCGEVKSGEAAHFYIVERIGCARTQIPSSKRKAKSSGKIIG